MTLPSLHFTRRRVAAAAIALVAAAGIAEGVHAAAASSPTTSTAATSTASPSPHPGAAKNAAHPRRHGAQRIARVVSTTATSITVADPKGTQTTLTVTPRTRVTDSADKKEAVTAIPAGEIVVVDVANAHRRSGAAAATPAATPAAPVALAIHDTGFAAR